MELAGQIAIVILVTLLFLTIACALILGIAGCYDFYETKPFTKAMEKIEHALFVVDLISAALVVVALWINILS